MSRPFRRVVLRQSLPQAIRLNTNNGIGVLIERVPPVKDIEPDRIFLDLGAFARKGFLTEV
jgi:hypothetical protein